MGRFHTGKGEFVGWAKIPNFMVSLRQALVRKMLGRIPRLPWIPFTATNAIAKLVQKDWVIWEIGSGYSTLWLADRAGKVTSTEASKTWFTLLSESIQREKLSNVDLRYEWQAERMADFSDIPDGQLDLLFIDGGPRSLCLENGFGKVKSGGYVYLDNWDNDDFWRDARIFISNHAPEISQALSYVDYVPAQVGVYEGLLVKKT